MRRGESLFEMDSDNHVSYLFFFYGQIVKNALNNRVYYRRVLLKMVVVLVE